VAAIGAVAREGTDGRANRQSADTTPLLYPIKLLA